MIKNYVLFLNKKKFFYIPLFFFLFLISILYLFSFSNKQDSKIYLIEVKLNNQELFLSKEFVQWSKDTISKVYFNNSFELNSVEDLDKFNTLNDNLKNILFNNLKKALIKDFYLENVSSLEIISRDNSFDHYLKNLNEGVSSQDILVSYEEYLINSLTLFLILFNDDQNLNLKKLAEQFLTINLREQSKNNLYDRIIFLIAPFLLTFLISLIGFYNEPLKK